MLEPLSSTPDRPLSYVVIARFRRTVASTPDDKRLIEVRDEDHAPLPLGAEPGQLCPTVIFAQLRDSAGRLYWAKKWTHHRTLLLPTYRRVEATLRALHRDDLCLSLDDSDEFGLIFAFDESLFASASVVHYWDRYEYFSSAECACIEQVGEQPIGRFGDTDLTLKDVCDFQIARDGSGRLTYLDFEPVPKYAFSEAEFRDRVKTLMGGLTAPPASHHAASARQSQRGTHDASD